MILLRIIRVLMLTPVSKWVCMKVVLIVRGVLNVSTKYISVEQLMRELRKEYKVAGATFTANPSSV